MSTASPNRDRQNVSPPRALPDARERMPERTDVCGLRGFVRTVGDLIAVVENDISASGGLKTDNSERKWIAQRGLLKRPRCDYRFCPAQTDIGGVTIS